MESIHPINELINVKSLGFYNCCEVTTSFLYQIKEKRTYHFYSIFVAEERIAYNGQEESKYLTPQRLNVSENVSLGIQQSIVPFEKMECYYNTLNKAIGNETVNIGKGELIIGNLEEVPKCWVSKDSTVEFKLNRIIKNNFRNGSYLLEFFDTEKCVKNILSDKEIKKVCEILYTYIPIDLFTLSDRIGNFIFQFPSLNVNISYRPDEQEKKLLYQVSLDSRLVGTKGYRLISEIISDDAILGFGTQDIIPTDNECVLEMGDVSKLCRTTLIDSENQLIISRQETTFIKEFLGRIHMGSQFGKEREIYNSAGDILKTVDVLTGSSITTGKDKIYYRDELIELRKYNLRMEEVKNSREFLRYGITREDGREKAINDIIELMNRGDGRKVYLWDPYLSAQDILDTWYCTKYYGVEFKAITSRADCNRDIEHSTMKEWIFKQAELLQNGSNHYGIKMEFRCQWKGYGYEFHDRFVMIVDENEPPLVWSLGASINSVGNKHHIIQKVLHPQMIVDAFEELWDMLSDEECLVWKTPN